MEKDAIGIVPQLEEPFQLSALLTQCRIKGNNCINYMQYDSIDGLPQFLEEQLIWNDIISLNLIENQKSQWYQLHAIGFN